MPFTPKVWLPGPGGGTPINAAALIDLEERVTDYADGVATAGPQGLPGMTYTGPWAPSTVYAEDDVVTFAGSAFIVTTAHTSTSTFDVTKFDLLAASGDEDIFYTSRSTDQVISNTTSFVDILSHTVTLADTSPIRICAEGYLAFGNELQVANWELVDATANIVIRQKVITLQNAEFVSPPPLVRKYTPPAAGARTFKVRWKNGTATVDTTLYGVSAGGEQSPIELWAKKA